MHICAFLDFQEHVRAFQSLLWSSHYPSFLLGILVSLLFVITVITASSTCYIKQLLLIVSKKQPQAKLFTPGKL